MNTDAHTEIEVKFAATPETEPPELAGAIEGVVSESSDIHFLSAVYFDTEDLRLTRNKITLRLILAPMPPPMFRRRTCSDRSDR